MNTPAAVSTLWEEVMRGLTGLRLAVHDELLNKGAMDYERLCRFFPNAGDAGLLAIVDAIRWLAERRLLVIENGSWRAVHPKFARVQVEMNGFALAPDVVGTGLRTTAPAPVERGRTAAVQRHQVEFFTNDGYREANGSAW